MQEIEARQEGHDQWVARRHSDAFNEFHGHKTVVQICVLFKRWKECSSLSCKCKKNFKKFVSWVLFSGDHSCSLLSVDIMSWIESEALDVFIEYVMLHNVQQLTMHIGLSSRPNLDSLPLVFCSKSLASLQLSGVHDSSSRIVLPKSLHLHALTILHLECVYFTSIDNDCAEPFSNCPVLNTLFIWNCEMHNNAKVCIWYWYEVISTGSND